MEKKYHIIFIVSVMLITIAFVANLYCLFGQDNNGFTYVVSHIINLIALVSGLMYLINGADKESAIWFKLFEIFLSLSFLAGVLRYSVMGHSVIAVLLMAIAYGFVTSLYNATDIGKQRSYAICGILLLIEITTVVIASVSHHISLARAVSSGSRILMIVILWLLMSEKYYDKAFRGAK